MSDEISSKRFKVKMDFGYFGGGLVVQVGRMSSDCPWVVGVHFMSKVQEDKFQIPRGHLFDEDNAWCVDES